MKKYFYELNYTYHDENDAKHYFMIGYFSNVCKVSEAIELLLDKPGFKERKGDFESKKIAVTFFSNITDKSGLILYELSHEYLDDSGYDRFCIFGVYSSYDEAYLKQEKKKQERFYCDHQDGFCIAEYKVDMCNWVEGFTSW